MKKYICILLFSAFVFLCSCESNNPSDNSFTNYESSQGSDNSYEISESKQFGENSSVNSKSEHPGDNSSANSKSKQPSNNSSANSKSGDSVTTTSDTIEQRNESEDLPFRKPDFEIDKSVNEYSYKKQTICYKNVTSEKLDGYIKLLVSDGFEKTQLEKNARYYLKKDNIYVYIQAYSHIDPLKGTESGCYISYTKGSSEARSNAISCEEAKDLIGSEDIIEIYIPDLYEKMHAQLFITTKEYQNFIIRNKKVYVFTGSSFNPDDGTLPWSHSTIDNYIVCDINKDNDYELLYEIMGTTSGIYSERIAAVNFADDKPIIKYSNNISFIPNNSISIIKQSNSEVIICYRNPARDESGSISSVLILKKVSIADGKISFTDID